MLKKINTKMGNMREPFPIAKDKLVGMRPVSEKKLNTTARPMCSLR